MNILLICASYSPRGSSPAFRSTNLAHYLERFGDSVTVLTYSENFQLRLDKSDESLKGKEVDDVVRINVSTSTNKNNSWIKKILYKFNIADFFLPDPHIIYAKKFIEEAKSIVVQKDIDVILTFSFPFTMHHIGYKLKKVFGEKVKWCLDYGDIWFGAPNTEWKRSGFKKVIDFYLEKKYLRKSDFISLTTKASIEYYKKVFGGDEKYILTPMGHDVINVEHEISVIDELSFLHTGRLYPPMRNPIPFIDLIKEDKNVNLKLIGYLDESFVDSVGEVNNVFVTDWLSKHELFKEMHNADVLILFGNESDLQIPGKLYEYFSFRKPIIYIHQELSDDPVLQLISDYNFIFPLSNLNIRGEYMKVLKEVKKFISLGKSNYGDEYSWENIANRLRKELK